MIQHASVGTLAERSIEAKRDGAPVVALHLLCHAGRAGRTWGLMLNGDEADEEGVAVDSWRLRQLLAPHADTLRLVVLAACGSAHGREFDSVAQALHRAGIQAVVASRFPLSVQGAIRTAQTLYDAVLAEQATLEDAFLLSRKQLARDASRLDWAGLQLYARAADGYQTRPFRTPALDTTENEGTPQVGARVDLDRLDLPALLELQDQVRSALASRFESSRPCCAWSSPMSTSARTCPTPGRTGAATACSTRYRDLTAAGFSAPRATACVRAIRRARRRCARRCRSSRR